jgi:catechol 2,3-dioxygenase-like lactoylglutathione lyase family enzyme
MKTSSLDHVALWVRDPHAVAGFLDPLEGMHVIEQTPDFTLIGGDAREGKLTLFAAEGERSPGVLGRIVLRVPDVDRALEALEGATVERHGDEAHFTGPEGIPFGLIEDRDGSVCDLDHLVLRVTDPEAVRAGFATLGLDRDGDELRLADRRLLVERGAPPDGEPILNHIALLIDSGEEGLAEVRRRGLEVTAIKDTDNTFAFFIAGPEQISIEYVEHKPTFSLT